MGIELLMQGSWRTKELGEKAFLRENPESTIIRPSIIFGPGDSFFNVSLLSLLSPFERRG
jgi:dTDP-4-dehydrorhamnose reductase